jgi:hypothetical protein
MQLDAAVAESLRLTGSAPPEMRARAQARRGRGCDGVPYAGMASARGYEGDAAGAAARGSGYAKTAALPPTPYHLRAPGVPRPPRAHSPPLHSDAAAGEHPSPARHRVDALADGAVGRRGCFRDTPRFPGGGDAHFDGLAGVPAQWLADAPEPGPRRQPPPLPAPTVPPPAHLSPQRPRDAYAAATAPRGREGGFGAARGRGDDAGLRAPATQEEEEQMLAHALRVSAAADADAAAATAAGCCANDADAAGAAGGAWQLKRSTAPQSVEEEEEMLRLALAASMAEAAQSEAGRGGGAADGDASQPEAAAEPLGEPRLGFTARTLAGRSCPGALGAAAAPATAEAVHGRAAPASATGAAPGHAAARAADEGTLLGQALSMMQTMRTVSAQMTSHISQLSASMLEPLGAGSAHVLSAGAPPPSQPPAAPGVSNSAPGEVAVHDRHSPPRRAARGLLTQGPAPLQRGPSPRDGGAMVRSHTVDTSVSPAAASTAPAALARPERGPTRAALPAAPAGEPASPGRSMWHQPWQTAQDALQRASSSGHPSPDPPGASTSGRQTPSPQQQPRLQPGGMPKAPRPATAFAQAAARARAQHRRRRSAEPLPRPRSPSSASAPLQQAWSALRGTARSATRPRPLQRASDNPCGHGDDDDDDEGGGSPGSRCGKRTPRHARAASASSDWGCLSFRQPSASTTLPAWATPDDAPAANAAAAAGAGRESATLSQQAPPEGEPLLDMESYHTAAPGPVGESARRTAVDCSGSSSGTGWQVAVAQAALACPELTAPCAAAVRSSAAPSHLGFSACHISTLELPVNTEELSLVQPQLRSFAAARPVAEHVDASAADQPQQEQEQPPQSSAQRVRWQGAAADAKVAAGAVLGVVVVQPDGSPCIGWVEAHPAVVRSTGQYIIVSGQYIIVSLHKLLLTRSNAVCVTMCILTFARLQLVTRGA